MKLISHTYFSNTYHTHIPFGLHDSHTSANLKAEFDLKVVWQVPSSAESFHTQKTEMKGNGN